MTQSWINQAKKLKIGGTAKVQHCGSDRSAIIAHTDRGYTLFCFRCKVPEFEPHGARGIQEIMATRREVGLLERCAAIPDDGVDMKDGPPAAHLWVLAGGLSPEDATDFYGMKWHALTRKVLIPLDRGFLARCVYSTRPKYRLFGSGTVYRLPGVRTQAVKAVVVVEDVLSAIAVHRAGWPSVALLGTSVAPEVAARIAYGVENVIGWFDNDRAGRQAGIKMGKALRLHPVHYSRINTDEDPKRYHRSTIHHKIDILARRWE